MNEGLRRQEKKAKGEDNKKGEGRRIIHACPFVQSLFARRSVIVLSVPLFFRGRKGKGTRKKRFLYSILFAPRSRSLSIPSQPSIPSPILSSFHFFASFLHPPSYDHFPLPTPPITTAVHNAAQQWASTYTYTPSTSESNRGSTNHEGPHS